jgi:hypothetical protein
MVATVGLLLGFPIVVGIAIVSKLWSSANAENFLIALTIIWAVLWGWSAFRVVRWPCPRCGAPWLANQEMGIGAKRCCSNCGLALYESP